MAGKCFTEIEMGRYVRERDRNEALFEEESKRALALKKTKLMSSTHIPDLHKELDDAAKNRALSDDECSDAETELFSFVAQSKCADADHGSSS